MEFLVATEKMSLEEYIEKAKKYYGNNKYWRNACGCSIEIDCDCGWLFSSCNPFDKCDNRIKKYIDCPYCGTKCIISHPMVVLPKDWNIEVKYD